MWTLSLCFVGEYNAGERGQNYFQKYENNNNNWHNSPNDYFMVKCTRCRCRNWLIMSLVMFLFVFLKVIIVFMMWQWPSIFTKVDSPSPPICSYLSADRPGQEVTFNGGMKSVSATNWTLNFATRCPKSMVASCLKRKTNSWVAGTPELGYKSLVLYIWFNQLLTKLFFKKKSGNQTTFLKTF